MEKSITPNISLFSQWLMFKLNQSQYHDNVYFEYNCRDAKIEHFQHIASQLIRNHEILRYCFFLENNDLKIRVIEPENIPVNIQYVDYHALTDCSEKVLNTLHKALNESFNLESAPLFRIYFIRQGDCEYKFVFVIPHVLVDTHTLHLFYDETSELFQKLLTGEVHPELSTSDIQFSSFIEEQNRSDFSPHHEGNKFWLSHFKGGISDVYLGDKIPSSEIIESKKNYIQAVKNLLLQKNLNLHSSLVLLLNAHKLSKYYTYLQILPKEILTKMEMLAKASGTTIFSIMASCYYLVIYKIRLTPDVTISYTLSTRDSVAKQNASGSFLNHLFIKQSIHEDMPIVAFIRSVHDHINQMKTNCNTSMATIWHQAGLSECNNIPLDINYFINPSDVITERVTRQEGIHDRLGDGFGFDIELKAIQGNDGLLLCYNYKDELFSKSYIEELTESLLYIINQITDSPYMPIGYSFGRVYDVI